MWYSITSKGEVASFESKNQFHMDFATFLLLRALLHNFLYICWWKKTSCAAFVPAPIVFSLKWHPSKLMGCNHHHKYTVTRPTAHSWVFNSQSMGCKEWQACGTQFPISLITPTEIWMSIRKVCQNFEISSGLLFGDCRGKIIRCASDTVNTTDAVFQAAIYIVILWEDSSESIPLDLLCARVD